MKKTFTIFLILTGFSLAGFGQTDLHHFLIDMNETGSNQEILRASTQTADGGTLIVTGTKYISSLSVGGIVLVKFDSQGNRTWNKMISGIEGSVATERVFELADGSFILGGNAGTFGNQGFYLKTNSTGDVQFFFQIGGGLSDIQPDASDNGFIITGFTSTLATGANKACLIVKTDAAGDMLWNHIHNYTANNDHYLSARHLDDGTFIAVGYAYTVPSAIWGDGIISKYSLSGELLWTKSYTSPEKVNVFSNFKIMPDNSLLLAGFQDEFLVGTSALITMVDPTGEVLWSKTINGNFTGLSFTFANNSIYAGAGISSTTAAILKIQENGDLTWSRMFKPTEQLSALDPIFGVDAVRSLGVNADRLCFSSYRSIYKMDTSVSNSDCYARDTSFTTTSIVPEMLPINPLVSDAYNLLGPFPALTTISEMDFQKYDACDFSSSMAITASKSAKATVFPNPSHDLLTVSTEGFSSGTTYFISDQTGRKHIQGTFVGNSVTTDIHELATGVYFLHIIGKEIHVVKFLKQ